MELDVAIDNVEDKIFAGDFNLETEMSSLVDSLLKFAPTLSIEQNDEFVSILQKMMEAQTSKDYLLVADVLEYELKKFLEKEVGKKI